MDNGDHHDTGIALSNPQSLAAALPALHRQQPPTNEQALPMIARLQQLITLSLLLLGAAILVIGLTSGHAAWALMAIAVLALGHMAFLGIEFLMLASVVRHLPALRPGGLAMIRAWIGEALHAPRAFCWRQPFRAQAQPDSLPNAPDHRHGVVLVHGLLCNRGFWNPWMTRLRTNDTPFIAVNLEPINGLIGGDLAAIEAAVSTMTKATGQAPVLVGHSRGGLVLRAWAACAPGNIARVCRIITIGTPHSGTWMARFARSSGSAEMQLGSPWLTDLHARETAESRACFTCFYSRCDNIVFPAPTATLAGADNREIAASAHIQMAFAPEVFAEVQRWLSSDATLAPAKTSSAHGGTQQRRSVSSKASGASSSDAATRR